MKTLESIIQHFGTTKEGGLTHRRTFLNVKQVDTRNSWYNRRKFA
ncbi:MAG: hypothetical protein WCE57_15650 [Salegentibacter sp.]